VHRPASYIINGITFYRLMAAPFLLYLVLSNNMEVFKWMLAVSFFTDAIDGWLARRFNVTSIFGAKLDSIADDMTVLAGIIGIIVLKPGFIREQIIPVAVLLGLFILQITFALFRYRKTTSFHTYLAKAAAISQGIFLILLFFLPEPIYFLFYLTVFVTAADLLEEILLVALLPEWKANVKGIYWVLRAKRDKQ